MRGDTGPAHQGHGDPARGFASYPLSEGWLLGGFEKDTGQVWFLFRWLLCGEVTIRGQEWKQKVTNGTGREQAEMSEGDQLEELPESQAREASSAMEGRSYPGGLASPLGRYLRGTGWENVGAGEERQVCPPFK